MSNLSFLQDVAGEWGPRQLEPVKVTLVFRSALTWDDYVGHTLEGMLQYAAIRETTGESPSDLFSGYRGPAVNVPCPVGDASILGLSVPMASQARLAESAASIKRLRTRRARTEKYNIKMAMSNGGIYKSQLTEMVAKATPYVTFYAMADAERLERLLCQAHGLGSDVSRGMGTLLGSIVKSCPDAERLWWRTESGAPARAYPVQGETEAGMLFGATDYELRMEAYRAPRHIIRNRVLCAVPPGHGGAY